MEHVHFNYFMKIGLGLDNYLYTLKHRQGDSAKFHSLDAISYAQPLKQSRERLQLLLRPLPKPLH